MGKTNHTISPTPAMAADGVRSRIFFAAALAVAVSVAMAWAGPARSDVDFEELLESEPAPLDEEALRREAERIEQEREAARRRAEARAHEAEAERLRRQAEWEALPRGARLVLERCTGCHEREVVAATGRSRWGWRGVVLRMEWFQDVDLTADDRRRIVEHLGAEHPPTPSRRVLEVAVLLSLPAALGAGVWLSLLYRRRSRR